LRADAGKSLGPVSCVRGFPRGREKPHAGRVCSPGNCGKLPDFTGEKPVRPVKHAHGNTCAGVTVEPSEQVGLSPMRFR